MNFNFAFGMWIRFLLPCCWTTVYVVLFAQLDPVCVLLRVRQKCNVKSSPLLYAECRCNVCVQNITGSHSRWPQSFLQIKCHVCLLNELRCLDEVDGMNVWLWTVIIFTKGEGLEFPGPAWTLPSPFGWNWTVILRAPSRCFSLPRASCFSWLRILNPIFF